MTLVQGEKRTCAVTNAFQNSHLMLKAKLIPTMPKRSPCDARSNCNWSPILFFFSIKDERGENNLIRFSACLLSFFGDPKIFPQSSISQSVRKRNKEVEQPCSDIFTSKMSLKNMKEMKIKCFLIQSLCNSLLFLKERLLQVKVFPDN